MNKQFTEENAKLLKEFSRQYETLYQADVNEKFLPFRKDAYDIASKIAEKFPERLCSFESFRGDLLSSDREIEAFGFAVSLVYGKEIGSLT